MADGVDDHAVLLEEDGVISVVPAAAGFLVRGEPRVDVRDDVHVAGSDGPVQEHPQIGGRAIEHEGQLVGLETDGSRRAVVNLDRLPIRSPFDVLGDEEIRDRAGRDLCTGEEREDEDQSAHDGRPVVNVGADEE